MAGRMSQGQARLQSDIHRLLTTLMQREIDDPRLLGVSITRLEPAAGGHSVVVWVHRIGSEEGDEVEALLNRLAGHFHHELRRALPKRRVPSIRFKWDAAFEKGSEVAEMLNRMRFGTGE